MLETRHYVAMKHLTDSQRLKAIAALVITVILWASAFIGIRAVVASNAYSPGQLSAARLLVASLLLGVLVAMRGGIPVPARRDWLAFFALGATGQMLYQLLLNTGERTVDGGTAALLVSTAPILASLGAVAFLGERLTVLGWVGTAIAFAGAATIAISSGASLHGGAGVLIVMAATCLWATYLVLQKTLAGRYDPLELTAWPMWIGATLLLPFAGGLPHAATTAPFVATAAVLWLGAFSSVAAFLTWAYAIRRLEVTVATSALYTVPVAAFVIGVVFLGEMPPASALLGGVVAISGVALVQLKGRPATEAPAVPDAAAVEAASAPA
jgi:drug/metabolite transporter (DMT)-like permease